MPENQEIMLRPTFYAIGLTLLSTSVPASAETFNLVCLGTGAGNRAFQAWGSAQDSNGNSAWGNSVAMRAVPYDDQVNVEITEDGASRVRMPRMMLPGMHGGKDGWFDVKKVVVGENEITGVVQVNVLNSPKLRIDRLQGRISIAGKSGNYSGECQRYDPAATARRF